MKNNKSVFSSKRVFSELGILLILAAMCAVLGLTVGDKFLTASNIISVARQFSFYGILATGLLTVILTGGIDISVGSVFALSGIVTCTAISELNLPVPVGVILGLAVGTLMGYVNGFCVTVLKIPAIIATLGMMSIARGIALTITNGYPVSNLPESFKFLGLGEVLSIPMPIIIMVVLAVITTFILRKTVLGRRIYAIGGNEEGSLFSGVHVNKIKRFVYAFSGFTAAVSGIIMAARLGVGQPTAGQSYEMDAIAATIIGGASLAGGIGTVFGAIIGAAIMGVLRNGLLLLDVSAYWQQTIIGLVIILAVAFDYLRRKKSNKAADNKKTKSNYVRIVLAAALALILIGCTVSNLVFTQKSEEITIAIVPKAINNSVFLDCKVGGEAKAAEYGVKIEYIGSNTADSGAQVTVVEGLIEKGVDGILISCCDADALQDVINRAVDAGIYVGTFDSDSPNSKRSFYCGTNSYAVGKLAAEKLLEMMPEGGKAAVLTGVLGAPNLEERVQGFKETLEGTNIDVVSVQACNDDVQTAVDCVTQYITANPDLDAWFFVGGWVYFADPEAMPEVKTFMENGGHIISIDTCEPMLKFVGLGMVDILIGQNYEEMGRYGVETIYNLIHGADTYLGDENNYVDTGYELADISNYEEIWANKTPWD